MPQGTLAIVPQQNGTTWLPVYFAAKSATIGPWHYGTGGEQLRSTVKLCPIQHFRNRWVLIVTHHSCPGCPFRFSMYSLNDHFRILNWRYLAYIRPIFQAYVKESPKKYGLKNATLPYLHLLDPGQFPLILIFSSLNT